MIAGGISEVLMVRATAPQAHVNPTYTPLAPCPLPQSVPAHGFQKLEGLKGEC